MDLFRITCQIFSSSLLNSLIASGLNVGQHKTVEFLAKLVLDFFHIIFIFMFGKYLLFTQKARKTDTDFRVNL